MYTAKLTNEDLPSTVLSLHRTCLPIRVTKHDFDYKLQLTSSQL